MRNLPRDPSGLPIPWTVLRDSAGRAHFQINDHARVLHCLATDLCPICAGKLQRGRWFVGGPLSALLDEGRYFDPPGHHACLTYALQVCPYLAAPVYAKRIDASRVPDGKPVILLDPTVLPGRPDLFVMALAMGQEIMPADLFLHIKPKRPWARMEYWRQGSRLSDEDGRTLADLAVARFLMERRQSDEPDAGGVSNVDA